MKGYELTVTDVSATRITRVLVRRQPDPAEAAPEPSATGA